MKQCELDTAIRRAFNIFDNWLETTGIVPKHSGYYCELQGIIKDAVKCGVQQALEVYEKLECEE